MPHTTSASNDIAHGFFRIDIMAYVEKLEFETVYDAIMKTIPLRRFGDIDDMKSLVVYPASDASAYMTGHILINDGGLLAK